MAITNLIEVVLSEDETEVIDIAYVKTYATIETDSFDTLLNSLIIAARQEIEKYSQVSIVERQITAEWSEAYDFVRLPYMPHGTIITVKDGDDTLLTLDSDYKVKGTKQKIIYGNFTKGLKVNYHAGYGSDTPQALKLAMTKNVIENFEQRTGITISNNNASLLPNNWRKVALAYRPTWIF